MRELDRLTTPGLGQLRQAQQCIVAGNRLECNIGVPSLLPALLLLCLEQEPVFVDLLGLLR
jgi:hypothetical protein